MTTATTTITTPTTTTKTNHRPRKWIFVIQIKPLVQSISHFPFQRVRFFFVSVCFLLFISVVVIWVVCFSGNHDHFIVFSFNFMRLSGHYLGKWEICVTDMPATEICKVQSRWYEINNAHIQIVWKERENAESGVATQCWRIFGPQEAGKWNLLWCFYDFHKFPLMERLDGNLTVRLTSPTQCLNCWP